MNFAVIQRGKTLGHSERKCFSGCVGASNLELNSASFSGKKTPEFRKRAEFSKKIPSMLWPTFCSCSDDSRSDNELASSVCAA